MSQLLDQTRVPLYEALCQYARSNHSSLHVPGHKDGRVFDRLGIEQFKSILPIDATSSEGIDDLHNPQTFIKEAESLAAEAFGADHTFFLVGGSTIGNIAAALTVCSPGDQIIVQRNMHKSVFNGLMIAGAKPIFIAPAIEPTTQVAKMPALTYFKEALKAYPNAKAIWITNPNYYGMSQNIEPLVELCHQHGIPLIVDEAHGAHFGQVEDLPPSALSQGADIVVQSTHKMLTAMTMASMLHIQGQFVHVRDIQDVLGAIQSTSPSYVLLASLDLARHHLVNEGRDAIEATIRRLAKRRKRLSGELTALKIWDQSGEVDYVDPLRWVIASKNGSVSGFELLDILHEAGCTAELSDAKNVMLLFSIAETSSSIDEVVATIRKVDRLLEPRLKEGNKIPKTDLFAAEGTMQKAEMTLQEAFHLPKVSRSLKEAVGKLAAETVLPYPPGIPLITPGERITAQHITAIETLSQLGGYFQGAADREMKHILTLLEDEE